MWVPIQKQYPLQVSISSSLQHCNYYLIDYSTTQLADRIFCFLDWQMQYSIVYVAYGGQNGKFQH